MEINDFRSMMGIEKKYPRPGQIKDRVLDPAKKELESFGDVTFEYSFSKIKSRSYNYISFKIFGTKRQEKDNPNEWYRMSYAYLCRAWPSYTNDKAQTIADNLSEKQYIKSFYNRMIRLDDELTNGKLKGMDHFVATMKKILKEDFEIGL
jgi:plasmid replication initiation protein